ncbi:coiled-coil domain-containing protein 186 isoform X2 [Fopius arisanus]|uniref:Coiled-coil domain-containing protein 186 isoform X2 n=1 Tax=Fopius arisanus TaxID=64838 RepID=A0A9R1U7Q8_9HYME|nr:PREDICTED: coiled-coil domain-containing protein 186 isoform X2 [Fopius arisanus]
MDENNCQLAEDVTVETLGITQMSSASSGIHSNSEGVIDTEIFPDATGPPIECKTFPETPETSQPSDSDIHGSTSLLDSSVAVPDSSSLETALELINDGVQDTPAPDPAISSPQENPRAEENEGENLPRVPGNFEARVSAKTTFRRSSLSEDSRLVKMSLPTNSINLIQSNAQFLNKSRNFLNFITEKSTNIMEKALLPQHIAARYNGNDRKKLQDFAATKFGSMQNIVTEKLPEPPENNPKAESFTVNVNKTDHSEEIIADPPNSAVIRNSNQDLSISSFQADSTLTDDIISPVNGSSKKESSLSQPNLDLMKEEKWVLVERIKQLEERNRKLEEENDPIATENREKTVERLTTELRMAMITQEELKKDFAAANKERESMVMKYAVGEKQLIDTQRARDVAEKKGKDSTRECELLQSKLKQALGERTRICGILDTKCKELVECQKEVERLKEDVSVKDVKLKWSQTKLKTEMEMQKETQQKLDKAVAKINEMMEECEQVRRESQETIRQFQRSEENKAVTLDHQLKEQQARLILERHFTEDKEILRSQLQKEVESLKNRQQVLIEENNSLSLKIQDLEKERLMYENNLSNLKIVADQRQKEVVDLTAKISHLETLKLQLIHKEQCLASNESEVARLRLVNQELQTDMDCCRQREAHMLEFTQKLTDKNVRLQSEFTSIEARANQLENEQGPLRECITEMKAKVKSLQENLALQTNKRIEECEILAKHLAEQTQLAQNLSQKLEDSQGENVVLRRKHQGSIKEMTRELQQCRKKLESYEVSSPTKSLDQTPRTSSDTSLNTVENSNGVSSPENSTNGEFSSPYTDLDKNSLIERILKMQRINVRRAEKLDFLEEHTRALVSELQKKTKIIQNYILHENFDAMGNNERDRYKAELARHGGIMASVYNHRVSDDNMTLELSLEINQKLQAVLEDALLKNITLKDNIDTLGEEIARLSIKNQQLQKSSK